MSPNMVELEQQPRTMRLRLTTTFVCKNRVLIRNSLCTKSTYGIHCVLSLQSQLRPNNRGGGNVFVCVTTQYIYMYRAFYVVYIHDI